MLSTDKFLPLVVLLGVQQHAVPEGGQGEPRPDVRLQELRLQDDRRQQLHLRQQDHARGKRKME